LDALQKAKTSPTIWRKGMHEALVMRKLEEVMANQLVMSEEEIQQYWKENRQILQQDIIHARQILVRTEAEAKRVLGELQEGLPFQAAVKQYSVDLLTKAKGGDLGWISRGEAFEEFEQAVFSLKPQQISSPVRGKYGYHIVQVLEKKKANEASLNDYRERVRGLIRQQKWQSERNTWLEKLKAEATVLRFSS
jgi:parvulin-like peptidyl-prolyl isomerase